MVGIVVTVGTGGNVALGAAAGFGTYQVWSTADDVTAELSGGESSADGHLSLVGAAIEGFQGDLSGAEIKMAAVDTVVDGISSFTAAGSIVIMGKASTFLAARGLPYVASRLPGGLAPRIGLGGLQVAPASLSSDAMAAIAIQNTKNSLALRMVSTMGGLTGNQGVASAGHMMNTGFQLGASGALTTREGAEILGHELRNQAFYMVAAPFTGAVAGRFSPTIRTQALIGGVSNFAIEEGRAYVIDGRHLNAL